MTTFTQTLAWCTSCAELAHSAHSYTPGDVISHLIGSSPEQTLCHPRSYPWVHLFDSLLPFYFHFSFLSFSVYFLHSELFPELDNPIVMTSLRYSADTESEDAYDVSTSPTTWKVMQRNVWNDIVSWQTERLNNSTKYLLHASMTTTLKRKK